MTPPSAPTTAARSAPIHGVSHTLPDPGLPAGACDCHVHVYGDRHRYPLAENRAFTPRDALLPQLIEHQQALGFARVVIVTASIYGTDNRCTLDAIGAYGPGARGVAVIDPDTVSDFDLRFMHANGIRGVRVNLETVGQHDPAYAAALLRKTAARIAPLRWHLQVFTNPTVYMAIADLIAALPVPVVFDHFGKNLARDGTDAPGLRVLCALLRDGRAWVKLSGAHRVASAPDCADAETLVQTLLAANPDRLVWGSDWPHSGAWPHAPFRRDEINEFHPIDDGHAVNRLRRWLGAPEHVQRVLVDNPARLYAFA